MLLLLRCCWCSPPWKTCASSPLHSSPYTHNPNPRCLWNHTKRPHRPVQQQSCSIRPTDRLTTSSNHTLGTTSSLNPCCLTLRQPLCNNNNTTTTTKPTRLFTRALHSTSSPSPSQQPLLISHAPPAASLTFTALENLRVISPSHSHP